MDYRHLGGAELLRSNVAVQQKCAGLSIRYLPHPHVTNNLEVLFPNSDQAFDDLCGVRRPAVLWRRKTLSRNRRCFRVRDVQLWPAVTTSSNINYAWFNNRKHNKNCRATSRNHSTTSSPTQHVGKQCWISPLRRPGQTYPLCGSNRLARSWFGLAK